jgi:hypothetical protein
MANSLAPLGIALPSLVLNYSLPSGIHAVPSWAGAASTPNSHVVFQEVQFHVLQIQHVRATKPTIQ